MGPFIVKWPVAMYHVLHYQELCYGYDGIIIQ